MRVLAPPGRDPPVERAQPDRVDAAPLQALDQRLVHLAAVDHQHHFERLAVGEAARLPAARRDVARLQPELARHPVKLHVPAVDKDRRLLHPRQVVQERLVVQSGAAAELDDQHDRSLRSRKYEVGSTKYEQGLRPGDRLTSYFVASYFVLPYTGCNPANSIPIVSWKPQRMFIACTPMPEAPFIRLSSAETTTTRLSRECSSTSKPTSQ